MIETLISEALELDYKTNGRSVNVSSLPGFSTDLPVRGKSPAPIQFSLQAEELQASWPWSGKVAPAAMSELRAEECKGSLPLSGMNVALADKSVGAVEPAPEPESQEDGGARGRAIGAAEDVAVSQEDGGDASTAAGPSTAPGCDDVVALQPLPPRVCLLEAGRLLFDFPMRIVAELTNPRIMVSSLASWDERRAPGPSRQTQSFASNAFQAALGAISDLFPKASRAARQIEDVATPPEKPAGSAGASSKRFI